MRLTPILVPLLAALLGAGAPGARAHDPSLHGFSMVSFDPPFPAPDFTAERLDGSGIRLSDWRGRHVLLNFWATWCPPCLEEMPSMERLHQRFRDRDLVVVAISSDREGAAVVGAFIERLGVSFPVLLDPEGEVARLYGARNLPMTVLIDPDGRVESAAQGARDWYSEEAIEVIDERLPVR